MSNYGPDGPTPEIEPERPVNLSGPMIPHDSKDLLLSVHQKLFPQIDPEEREAFVANGLTKLSRLSTGLMILQPFIAMPLRKEFGLLDLALSDDQMRASVSSKAIIKSKQIGEMYTDDPALTEKFGGYSKEAYGLSDLNSRGTTEVSPLNSPQIRGMIMGAPSSNQTYNGEDGLFFTNHTFLEQRHLTLEKEIQDNPRGANYTTKVLNIADVFAVNAIYRELNPDSNIFYRGSTSFPQMRRVNVDQKRFSALVRADNEGQPTLGLWTGKASENVGVRFSVGPKTNT